MKRTSPSNTNFSAINVKFLTARNAFIGLILAAGAVASAWAQGEMASGTISGTGTGPYTYSLTFSDAAGATSPIGSVWYAWTPGNFYLPSIPGSASGPLGWTANVNSRSVEYVASSSAYYIQPGHSLSGFGYVASFSPATLAGTVNSGLSVAYSAGLFSDSGNTFTVQPAPEPSSSTLLVLGGVVIWLVRRWKLRVA